MIMLIDGGAGRSAPISSPHGSSPAPPTSPPPKRVSEAPIGSSSGSARDAPQSESQNRERLATAAQNTQQKVAAAAQASNNVAQLDKLPPQQRRLLQGEINTARSDANRTKADAHTAVHKELDVAKQVLSPAYYEDYKSAAERDFEGNADEAAILREAMASKSATTTTKTPTPDAAMAKIEAKQNELQQAEARYNEAARLVTNLPAHAQDLALASLRTNLDTKRAELEKAQLQQAVQVLNRDFNKFDTAAVESKPPDGFVSRDDLKAVRDSNQYDEEQRTAARFLLDHPDRLNAMDIAAKHDSQDGFISRNDLTVYAVNNPDAIPALQSRTETGSDVNPTVLHIDAKAPIGAAWESNANNKAGIVSVYIDGKYFADATILSENPEGVDVNLGVLGTGKHTIEIRDTSNIGTDNNGTGVSDVRLSTRELNVKARDPADREAALIAKYSPIVHHDNNGQATNNTPLLTTARVTHKDGDTTIEYRILYSNEDGGFGEDPGKLADAWGRTTDDELVYKVTINDKSGAKTIVGNDNASKRVDYSDDGELSKWKLDANNTNERPVLTIVNEHNQYEWAAGHENRARNRAYSGAPLLVTGETTIDVMNAHPWTWKVSTAEIKRESELNAAKPYSRVYLNVKDATNGNLQNVTQVKVTLNDGSSIDYDKKKGTVTWTKKDGTLVKFDEYQYKGKDKLRPANPENASIELPPDVDPSQIKEIHVNNMPTSANLEAQYLSLDGKPVKVAVK